MKEIFLRMKHKKNVNDIIKGFSKKAKKHAGTINRKKKIPKYPYDSTKKSDIEEGNKPKY